MNMDSMAEKLVASSIIYSYVRCQEKILSH